MDLLNVAEQADPLEGGEDISAEGVLGPGVFLDHSHAQEPFVRLRVCSQHIIHPAVCQRDERPRQRGVVTASSSTS